MSDPRYLPTTADGRLAHLTEECGEVLQAVGKTLRFGLDKHNPELSISQPQETNRAWLTRELLDLQQAITAVLNDIQNTEA